MKIQHSVLIVGAGPTGLAAAIELRRLGVSVRIISKASHLAPDCRATWVHSSTLERLHESGAGARITDEGTVQRYFVIHDESGFEHKIDMSLVGGQYPFAVVLPQSRTEKVLVETLEKLGGKVEYNTELVDLDQCDEAVHCRIALPNGDVESVSYEHVIGADGAHSTVRKLCGIEFQGDVTDRDWTASEVRLQWPYALNETHTFAQNDGFLMAFRMNGDHFRILTNDGDIANRLPKEARLIEVKANAKFRVRHMQASKYQENRVYLAGDAAHVHSPYGGRGMNLGIADAVCLARLLAQGQQDLYTERRYNSAKASIQASREEWKRVYALSSWKRQLTSYIMWIVLRIPMMHRMIALSANGKK